MSNVGCAKGQESRTSRATAVVILSVPNAAETASIPVQNQPNPALCAEDADRFKFIPSIQRLKFRRTKIEGHNHSGEQ
jgi:hypothetical protein